MNVPLSLKLNKARKSKAVVVLAFVLLLAGGAIVLWQSLGVGEPESFYSVQELRGDSVVTIRHFSSGPRMGCELIVETGELLCP